MKSFVKKTMGLLIAFGIMSGTTPAFAESNQSIAQRRYDYFKEKDYKTGKVPTFDEYTKNELAKQAEYKTLAAKTVKQNYWSDLVWYENKNNGFGGFIPKDLIPYFQKNKLDWTDKLNESGYYLDFPTMGIFDDTEETKKIIEGSGSLNFMRPFKILMLSYEAYALDHYPAIKHKENPNQQYNYWKDGKVWNPYNFDAKKDLLYSDELKKINDDFIAGKESKLEGNYDIRADIKEKDQKSSIMVEHHIGDKLDLEFTVDTDLVRRIQNSILLGIIGSEFPAYYTMVNNTPENGLTQADGSFVYRMKLPKGLKPSKDTSYTISGAPDDFEVNVKKYDEQSNEITVGIRMKDVNPTNDKNKFEKLKDRFKKIQQLGKITLSVKQLEIGKDVEVNKPSQVIGRASGVYEYFYSTSDEALKNQDPYPFKDQYRHKDQVTTENMSDHHSYVVFPVVFAAKQSSDGIDEALEKDDNGKAKQANLISYSFIVKESTVTFMNGSKTHAKVKVETGKEIDKDVLVDEKMPANATKDGFIFKEWNTKADGTGTKFTGDTKVNSDLTVYAIFALKSSKLNAVPKLTVTDKTITKGESLDLKNLVISATDAEDGDLKAKVKISSDDNFDANKVGSYTIVFTVTDSNGASTTKRATVIVNDLVKKHGDMPKTGESKTLIFLLSILGFAIIGLGIFYKQKMMEENK